MLLIKALKNVSEGIVKDEISRRLALIAPKKYLQKRCFVCGKFFYQGRAKKIMRALCEDCFEKKV